MMEYQKIVMLGYKQQSCPSRRGRADSLLLTYTCTPPCLLFHSVGSTSPALELFLPVA